MCVHAFVLMLIIASAIRRTYVCMRTRYNNHHCRYCCCRRRHRHRLLCAMHTHTQHTDTTRDKHRPNINKWINKTKQKRINKTTKKIATTTLFGRNIAARQAASEKTSISRLASKQELKWRKWYNCVVWLWLDSAAGALMQIQQIKRISVMNGRADASLLIHIRC